MKGIEIDGAYGRVGYVIWQSAICHMAEWDISYGRVGYVIWQGEICHMAGWDMSYGRVGYVNEAEMSFG
jgi:hypothetical protein